jgi:membrane protein YqaA with SNARE-associated domain
VHIFDPALAETLLATYGYVAIFVLVMLESAGIPLPGETILVSASIYASTSRGLDIRFVIGAAAAGAIVGDNIGFWVGRTFGQRLLTRWGYLIGLDERKLKLGQYLFMRHGGKIVFFGTLCRAAARFGRDPRGGKWFLTVSFPRFKCSGRYRMGDRFRLRRLSLRRRRPSDCAAHRLGRLGASSCGSLHSLALL